MKISFDATNLLASVVGEAHGVTPGEWKEQERGAARVVENFRARVDRGEVGFPLLPLAKDTVGEILKYANKVRGRYDTVCLLGIGGSALGAWALDCALRGPHPVQKPFSSRHPRLIVLDNVDPCLLAAALEIMDPKKTLVLAVSKQGTTVETMAALLVVREWLGKRASGRMVAITTPERGELYALALRENWQTFSVPDNVGGRFSVLSAVGLVPAALLGLNIRKLLKGAAEMTELCWEADPERNPALRSALLHHVLWVKKNKSIHVAFAYSNRLWGTAFWFRQLWAESLGKARTREGELVQIGQTPLAALGATDQHSQLQLYVEGPNDKVFTFWAVEKHPQEVRIPKTRPGLPAVDYLAGKTLASLLEVERLSTEASLTLAQRPNCVFRLARLDEEHLGGFLQLLEFQTAFMGELLGINAFDQPGVEQSKQFIYGLMGRPGYDASTERFQQYRRAREAAR